MPPKLEQPGQTKRSSYRRLNQMNGDFLLLLKKPICSEIGRDVKGHNHSYIVDMKKELNIMYKQRDIELAKVRRSQEAVYSTMLRMHKVKKMRQRDAYRQMQEDSRSLHQRERRVRFSRESFDTEDTADDEPRIRKVAFEDEVPRQESLVSASEEDLKVKGSNPADVQTEIFAVKLPDIHEEKAGQKPRKKPGMKSKVLEVRKGAPTDPIVSERVSPTKELVDFKVIIEKRNSGLDPDEPETTGSDKVVEDNEADTTRSDENLTRFSKIHPGLLQADAKNNETNENQNSPRRKLGLAGITKDGVFEGISPPSQTCDKRKTSIVAMPKMPAIEEHKVSQNNPHDREKPNSQPVDASLQDLGLPVNSFSAGFRGRRKTSGSEGSSTFVLENRGHLSQVEINKLQALEREQRMRDVLNRETFPVYVKDSKGNIIPSILPFSRKTFEPPSLREKHFQHKMLREEFEGRVTRDQKLCDFYSKVEADGLQRQKLREHRISEAPPVQQPEDNKRRPLGNGGQISITQVMTAFARQAEIPEHVDPKSFEALKYCKYIRTYTPPNRKRKRRSKARREKNN